ncbi:hypothetical protein JRI60_01845 [Archangium violaceum]|uniref:hypothetical protein n=1 Tax=Archangium violaceum TaxID=83451 RepID=UPI00194ECBBB|nr:hypothetical protein [Archangium violaceum]QRN97853.1 hypothetical protein JRI60_01845 [Archangium violaceum]
MLMLVLLAFSGVSWAGQDSQETGDDGSDSQTIRTPRLLLPLKLEGSTEGTGTLRAGVGFLVPTGKDSSRSLGLVADYRVQTSNGLAKLFGLTDASDAKDSRPWTLGFTGTLVQFPELVPPTRTGKNSALGESLRKAVRLCAGLCTVVPQSEPNQSFCSAYEKAVTPREDEWIKGWNSDASTLPASRFCESEKKGVSDADQDLSTGKIDSAGWRAARGKALRSCLRKCTADASDPFCELPRQPVDEAYSDISSTLLCPAGKSEYQRSERELGRSRAFPPLIVNAGARFGINDFKYRSGSSDDPNVLLEGKSSLWDWSVGASAIGVVAGENPALTIEGLMVSSSKWTPSSKAIRWCSPAGVIPRGDNATDPAETCQEAVLGAPVKSRTLKFAGFIGLADNYDARWRAALGGEFVVPTRSGATELYSSSLQGRFFWSFASDPSGLKYKGILRLSPGIRWTRNRDDSVDLEAFVTLALLGERFLFTETFDEL